MKETESVKGGKWEGNRQDARAAHSNILRATTHNGIPPVFDRFLRIQLVAAYCWLRITERVFCHHDDDDKTTMTMGDGDCDGNGGSGSSSGSSSGSGGGSGGVRGGV
ncbi:hypothetical protein M0802_007140 [Mischocyttarus mexicanus]|nr:hypothetical protein M0802_007140 [Mischocyttarus mexicanus]